MSPCGRACKASLPRLAGQGRHIVFTLPLSVALAFAGGSCAAACGCHQLKVEVEGLQLAIAPGRPCYRTTSLRGAVYLRI